MDDLHHTPRTTTFIALALLSAAACAAPPTAIAPGEISTKPRGETPGASGALAGASARPIRAIALSLLEPLALAGLVSDGGTTINSESGEARWLERLVDAQGHERLAVESTLLGAIRRLQRSGVPLDAQSGIVLSTTALIARAAAHLKALGASVPSGAPTIAAVAGRQVLSWARRINGALVPGDGTRVVLALDGSLVGLAIDSSPLAAVPSQVRTASEALAAASAIVPTGATISGAPALGWIAPSIDGGDEEQPSAPRRLVWRVRGSFADGSPFEIDLEIGRAHV